MRSTILYPIFIFLFISQLRAQQMSGVIVDMDDNIPLPGAIIHNINRNESVIADDAGKYAIHAQKGDTIAFSYLGYYSIHILMPEPDPVYRRISLRKKTFSLEEIQVRPGLTTYQRDSIERRAIYGLTLNREKESSVMSPVTLLAESISPKSRQRWRFQRNFIKWEGEKFIQTRYTPDLVSTLTHLSDDSLAAFMNQFPMPEDFARTASDLELKMWIKYNYRVWIKHPRVPRLPVHFVDSSITSR